MFYTALILGFAGSLHCAGMCSPLLMAVTRLSSGAAWNRLLYNAGRILTYSLLGALCSSFGALLPIGNYQTVISILFGLVLMILAVSKIADLRIPLLKQITLLIRKRFSHYLNNRNSFSVFAMGMVNGLLPCGLSALALSYCVLLPASTDGFNFMLLFGVGTLPMMLGLAPLVIQIISRLRFSIKNATTSMMFLSGVILIIRTFLHAGVQHPSDLVDMVICR
ncbi:MAG: sulfite exporter TauE/SafE family protein [Chryseolinea sp.]